MLEAFQEYHLGMENVAWFHNRMICYLYLHTWLVKIALQSQILMNSFVVIVELLSRVWLLCNPMACSPPGFFVHGILQARILEWVTIPFSRGSSWSRDWTQVSWKGRQTLYHWATNFSEQYFLKHMYLGASLGGTEDKNLPANAGRFLGLIPWLGRSSGD